MRTKDIACVLSPHSIAVEHGRTVAQALLDHGWKPLLSSTFAAPALASSLGDGLRRLLNSPKDLHQAHEIANLGLLAGGESDALAFEGTGKRLLSLVVEPLGGQR